MAELPSLDGVVLLSDIDGTLVCEINGERHIPEKNIAAIEKFKALGGRFGLSTGRSMRSAMCAVNHNQLTNCPSVTYNGSVVYDFSTETVLKAHELSAAARCRIFELIKKFPNAGVEAHIDYMLYCLQHNSLTERHSLRELNSYKLTPIADLPIGRWQKGVFIGEPDVLDPVKEYIASLDLSNEDYYFMSTERTLFEILPKTADKGKGVLSIAEALNVSLDDIWTIGDYYNDIEMLKVSRNPVTVSGAPDELKNMAKYVTCKCEDGAVADLIEHIIEHYAVK